MKHILWLFLILSFISVNAQVAVSTDGMPADSSAMLDVRSTSKGMLIPRMSSVQREMIASPATGLLVFDATTASFWFFDGTAWSELVTNTSVIDQLADSDGDTRVEVEQNPDEDRIRFVVGGTEYFRMDSGKVHLSNSGGSVLIGRNAGFFDDLSDRNSVAIGDSALHYNGDQTQYYHSVFNTAVGSRSLLNNSTGFYNTGLGGYALIRNTSGHRNTAVGVWALKENTIGTHNTAIGMEALNGNISGMRNTVVGFRAGYNAIGSDNVFLGSNAGFNEAGSGKLYIDNAATSTPLIFGDFTSDSLVIHGKLAFKTDGAGPVYGVVARDSNDVLQYMTYPRLIDSLQAYGLPSGGGSDADWLIAGGGIPLDNLSHIYHEDSVTIGKNTPAGTGVLNILGRLDVISETDSSSMGVGMNALGNVNTGANNTAIGYHALFSNSSGHGNTAIGRGALIDNTSGSKNTALGSFALN